MARKMMEWPSKHLPIPEVMPLDGCKGDTFPSRRDNGGAISTNLHGIWGMSAEMSKPLGPAAATLSVNISQMGIVSLSAKSESFAD